MSSKTKTAKAPKLDSTVLKQRIYKYRHFYFMFLPVLILFLIFNYIPMIGILIAFFDWGMFGPNEFVGLDNFVTLFKSAGFWNAFRNTLTISLTNLIFSMVLSVGTALLIDEIIGKTFKKFTQTILYIPHFLSWVVVASVFSLLLSPKNGMINNVIVNIFNGESIYFLASKKWWTPVFLFINRWKETGWGTIIFIAALTGVDQEMYEAAKIDGSTRLQRVFYITLPSIQNTILIVFVLNLAKVLNIFESVFVLYNPMVYAISDVLGTYVYRLGILGSDYGMSTAIGLFKSVVSLLLVTLTNKVSYKIKGEEII